MAAMSDSHPDNSASSSIDRDELLSLARAVAAESAQYASRHRPQGRVEVHSTKSSATDVVTHLDRECEDLIRGRILDARPDDGFIGEEGEPTPHSSGVTWIVDPIDGTVNFVYGLPDSAVSIAASLHGRIEIGVVVNISTGEEYFAQRGGGSFYANQHGGVRLKSEGTDQLSHALIGTGFHYTLGIREHQAQAVARLLSHVRDIRRTGSAALDLCRLAHSKLDGYVEQGLKPWDLAAGSLIAEEAGIILAGLGVEPDERLVIAAPGALAEEFFALVRSLGF